MKWNMLLVTWYLSASLVHACQTLSLNERQAHTGSNLSTFETGISSSIKLTDVVVLMTKSFSELNKHQIKIVMGCAQIPDCLLKLTDQQILCLRNQIQMYKHTYKRSSL